MVSSTKCTAWRFLVIVAILTVVAATGGQAVGQTIHVDAAAGHATTIVPAQGFARGV